MRNRSQAQGHREDDASRDRDPLPSVGKRTLTAIVQRKGSGAPDRDGDLPADSAGAKMPAPIQAKMEGAFGADFSAVRIHEGPRSDALGARAYTQGTDLHFAPGQYDPGSERGQVLIAHELAHVVQQSQGRVSATRQAKGVGLNDDSSLEREADEMAAKAVRGEKVSAGAGAIASGGGVVQREAREERDLDYGFNGPRGVAMTEARRAGKDNRGDVSPTVDDLNADAGITPRMQAFQFFQMLQDIQAYNGQVHLQPDEKSRHICAWRLFLKRNIARIDLSTQVANAIAIARPVEATKDRLHKNEHKDLGAPDRATIRDWYNTHGVTAPAHGSDERERLEEWVWNAFFRITSKLGLEFTAEQHAAIHFNVSRDAYGKALGGRRPGAHHGRNAITYSELRHLKRLQDRGQAPTVHFEDNHGGVHDVDSPTRPLDMLDAAGIKRMLQTAEWKREAVAFELRLGRYLAGRNDAKKAVQDGLTKMDSVMQKNNQSKPGQWAEHRKVFGQTKPSSAGQVGTDPDVIRSVLKGQSLDPGDPVNMREQMTAFYNGGLWNSRNGTTMSNIMAEVTKIDDADARKARALELGLDEGEVEKAYLDLQAKLEEAKRTLDTIAALPAPQRLQRAKDDLRLGDHDAQRLVAKIATLLGEKDTYKRELDPAQRQQLRKAYFAHRRKLAKKHAAGLLGNAIDKDTSRIARLTRSDHDNQAQHKSAQDYAALGVPLSKREKTALGGVPDETAKLPWEEGIAYFRIDETTPWAQEMKAKGMPVVAGNSGTAARMMTIFQWLHAGDPFAFRMAIMGWMLPGRDHSLLEILVGAKTAGVTHPSESTDDAVKMYRNLHPLATADLRANVADGGLFPEERVLRTVDDPTYKQLIRQG